MSTKHLVALVFAALALPTSAFAKTPVASSPEQRSLTWDELKDACAHPMCHGNQLPPTNLHVVCADVKTGWRQTSVIRGSLHDSLTVSVSSTKGYVSPEVTDDSQNDSPDCFIFAEENTTRRLTLDGVTCDEIAQFDTEEDYCTLKLTDEPAVVEATGREINTCNVEPTEGGSASTKGAAAPTESSPAQSESGKEPSGSSPTQSESGPEPTDNSPMTQSPKMAP